MSDDYAKAATERLLMKYDENRIPLTHVAQLQQDIRLAILEAMRDQRYACIEAAHELQTQGCSVEDFLDRLTGVLHNAAVKVTP